MKPVKEQQPQKKKNNGTGNQYIFYLSKFLFVEFDCFLLISRLFIGWSTGYQKSLCF
jgi:hypothetical protein